VASIIICSTDCAGRLRARPAAKASSNTNTFCDVSVPTGQFAKDGTAFTTQAFVTGSEVNRWGAGVMQEIDSAAMHVWFNWQHLDLNFDARSACGATTEQGSIDTAETCSTGNGHSVKFGDKINTSYDSLDIFMLGGVIFF
jgi:hypothetical protein